MDFSSDELRRQAWETQGEHVRAMRPMRELVARLFGGEAKASPQNKLDLMVGGFNRRRFIRVGSISIASAAVLAACGQDEEAEPGDTTRPPTTGEGSETDILITRTASSLEELAVVVYQTAIDSGLVKTPAVADTAKLFQAQHKEHSGLFQGATSKLGGEPFTKPNPAVIQQLQPRIEALKTESDIVVLAYDLENVAAQTYQSAVGAFSDKSLNKAAMSVGGVEARHVAALGVALNMPGKPPVPKAFQTTETAVKAGTGVS